MPSSPIERLTGTLTADTTPSDLTDSDHRGLLNALAQVPDPRDPRGVRYPLAGLLAIAVCAVLAGAVTFAAIADWLEDLPADDLHRVGLPDRRPVATTIWRLLVRLDPVALSSALAGWLLSRQALPTAPAGRRVIAIDGKTVRGTVTSDGRRVHLLAAYDVATGITLAQIPLDTKGGEIAQVKPLVDQVEAVLGTVTGVVFVADALHAQTIHATDLTARGAALLVTVKANQRGLHNRLKARPWPHIPVGDRTRDQGHGRRETRTLKAVTVATPTGLGFPHAAQAVRITRHRRTKNKTSRETAYLIVTLPAGQAPPADLNLWARLEWHIENRLHWRRDMTLREDEQRATTGHGPAVFATLRSTAIGYHLTNGATNVARAIRHTGRNAAKLLNDVSGSTATTQ